MNGKIWKTKGNKVGSVAKYFCFRGYELEEGSGDKKRVCLSDGKWSGTAPACMRKFKHQY